MEIERLRPALDLVGDDQTTARALSLLARAYWVGGQVARADELTQRAVEHAQRAGDARQAGHALAQLGFYALTGPMPVPEGIARCEEMLRQAGDDRRMQASVLQSLAGLHSLQGAFDRGRELSAASMAILTDLGLALAAAQASVERAFAELYAGDPIAAEAEARHGYEVLERMGEKSYLCSAAALLALTLHLQGLPHEAARFAKISEETASTDDVISQLGWRGARARALADEGRLADAERLARAAVDRVSATDLLFLHGDALVDLAQIRHRQGALDEAVHHAQQAVVLYRRKAATVLERNAEALAEKLADERASQGARR
jgi:tetratricopeptide (TPR) repeat protein